MPHLSLARIRCGTVLAAAALAVGIAGCGADDETSSDAAATVTSTETTTTSTAPTATTATTPTIGDAQEAIDADEYAAALAVAAVLTAAEANAVRRRISNRIARRVRFALSSGDRGRASRLLRQAGKYPTTASLAGARGLPSSEGTRRRARPSTPGRR